MVNLGSIKTDNFIKVLINIADESDPVDVVDPSIYLDLLKATSRLALEKDRSSLIGVAHLAYGWMPRMLKIHQEGFNFQNAWHSIEDNSTEIEFLLSLKGLINNSIVGASKVLHFIRPDYYPIFLMI